MSESKIAAHNADIPSACGKHQDESKGLFADFFASRIEFKAAWLILVVLFAFILIYPVATVLVQSFLRDGVITLANWVETLSRPHFRQMLANSFIVSGLSGLISALIAFFAAYGLTFTNVDRRTKKAVQILLLLPLFLPSITYGFAVIYSFGRMGLVTQLLGAQLAVSIYGFWGLLITDVVYTVPPAFLVLYNAFLYVDRRFVIVSCVLGDNPLRTFWVTACRPTVGAFVAAFVLSFFLAFTDFGIPVSVAGQYNVIATELYTTMMGAVPDFGNGAVIAIAMLVPSVAAVWLLKNAERLNFRYSQISTAPAMTNRLRDAGFYLYFLVLAFLLFSILAVVFIVPFVEYWPYKPYFTLQHIKEVLSDDGIGDLYLRSIGVAAASAVVGTACAFAAGMIRSRSDMPGWCRTTMDAVAMLTSTLPGMVLGVGYLFAFSGTSLQNTLLILILANLVHFLATPYLMASTALSKMNAGWETTGLLMGDSWFKSVCRIIVPNSRTTLIQMFETYFINSMVTISAIVFLTGSRTMVLTTRIKELQYFERFDAIFALSMLIFLTNIVAKLLFDALARGQAGRPRSEEKTV